MSTNRKSKSKCSRAIQMYETRKHTDIKFKLPEIFKSKEIT